MIETLRQIGSKISNT